VHTQDSAVFLAAISQELPEGGRLDWRYSLSPAPSGECGTVDTLISDFQPPECFVGTSTAQKIESQENQM